MSVFKDILLSRSNYRGYSQRTCIQWSSLQKCSVLLPTILCVKFENPLCKIKAFFNLLKCLTFFRAYFIVKLVFHFLNWSMFYRDISTIAGYMYWQIRSSAIPEGTRQAHEPQQITNPAVWAHGKFTIVRTTRWNHLYPTTHKLVVIMSMELALCIPISAWTNHGYVYSRNHYVEKLERIPGVCIVFQELFVWNLRMWTSKSQT